MNRPGSTPDAQLEASLRRIRGALDQNRSQYAGMVEQIMADTGREVAERVTARLAEAHQRRLDRWERLDAARRERWQRRLERRRSAGGDPAEASRGVVFVVVAVACLVVAVVNPELWWLVFVALGLGMSGAQAFGRASRRGQAQQEGQTQRSDEGTAESQPVASTPTAAPAAAKEAPKEAAPQPPPAEPADPKVARIQNLCDKLLAALESGPPIVREVVTQPQATIGGLRQACLEIARRERELREALAAQDEAQLVAERDGLAARVSNEHDEIVRDRLGQALRALEQQLAHRAELATAATRLEAENTRILYTLENLHMQILRARSTDVGAPELGGKLRDSLRDLGTEIDAVAEALEWASGPGDAGKATAAAPEAGSTAADAGVSTADRARVERLDAARRAAQAREAQRR